MKFYLKFMGELLIFLAFTIVLGVILFIVFPAIYN